MVTDAIEDLEWRGLISQSTDREQLRTALRSGPITFYAGFDPTAVSLHVGHLALLLTLRRLQRAGHRPIGLVGGATGLIGDPSGKAAERALNPTDVVDEWVQRIRRQVERFLDFTDSAPQTRAVLVSNLDWTGELSAVEFLRDVGKHFSLNRMLSRESVAARLHGSGISYTEFSYMVLQALDYLELYRRYGCTLQLGGSDQWGNIMAGVELVRRVEGAGVHALTTPLIARPDGTKLGKSDGGTVWLDPDLTSPYAFYQFWINVADAEVGTLLRVFSFRSREEVEELQRETEQRPAARVAQQALAEELTATVHGSRACERARQASEALFGRGRLAELDEDTLASALAEVPRAETGKDVGSVAELLVRSGLSPSKSAARRTIAEGGAYVNNRKVADVDDAPEQHDLLHGRYLVLRRGKRHVAGVEVTGSE